MRTDLRVFLFLALLLLATKAFATGIFIVQDSQVVSAQPKAIRMYVHHAYNREELYYFCRLELAPEQGAVLVIPVPGVPDGITCTPCKQDRFTFTELKSLSENRSYFSGIFLKATQIYPLIFEFRNTTWPGDAITNRVNAISNPLNSEVKIELQPFTERHSLERYFTYRNLDFDPGFSRLFDTFFTRSHVFVIAKYPSFLQRTRNLSAKQAQSIKWGKEHWICLKLVFSTDDCIVPLKPVTTPTGKAVGITIFSSGTKTMCAMDGTKLSQSSDNIFVQPYAKSETIRRGIGTRIFPLENEEHNYVRLTDASSKPIDYCAWFAELSGRNGFFILLFCIFIAVSCLSSAVSGLLTFGHIKVPAFLGLWNVLTILGFSRMYKRARKKNRSLFEKKDLSKKMLVAVYAVISLIGVLVILFQNQMSGTADTKQLILSLMIFAIPLSLSAISRLDLYLYSWLRFLTVLIVILVPVNSYPAKAVFSALVIYCAATLFRRGGFVTRFTLVFSTIIYLLDWAMKLPFSI